MTRFILFILPLLITSTASAQLLSYGLKGGVALTSAFDDHTYLGANSSIRTFSNSKDFVIGPILEVHLPLGLGVEADALFRPYYLDYKYVNTLTPLPGSNAIHAWEFPILAKYRLPAPILRPYVSAGPSFRAAGGSGGGLSGKGLTIVGGIDVKALILHVSPELRYTYWGQGHQLQPFTTPAFSGQNQLELLVGVTF